jgi:MinD superfamily P-loop ATPase
VLDQLDIKFGIVINKFDAWKEGCLHVKDYAKSRNIPIIGEIPIDNAIPQSIVKGKPVVSYAPDSPASKSLNSIYQYLRDKVLILEKEQLV